MPKKKINLLVLILLLAGALRLIGITHGFPFVFHPDEPTIVRSALGLRFFPNPKHFDWPHLYIYFNYFLYMVFAKFRDIIGSLGLKEVFTIFWNEEVIFYLLTRCLTAILGAATVIPVYLTAKNLFNKKIAIFSSLAFALIPFHVWHSHYSLSDAPMVFLLSWAMYFGTKILKEGKLLDYIFAGFFVGLSASTKYNGGLGALVVPLAYILRKAKEKKSVFNFKEISYMFLSGLTSVIGFVLGTPYSVLDFGTFSRKDGPKGALWQFSNVGSVSFPEHVLKFLTGLFYNLQEDFGYSILIGFLVIFGIVAYRVIKKREKDDDFSLGYVLIPAMFYIWYISGFDKNRSHYFMISYPFVAVSFGYFVQLILDRVNKEKFNRLIVAALFCVPLVSSINNTYTFVRGDTRNDLRSWLSINLQPEEKVIYNDRRVVDVIEDAGGVPYKGFPYIDKLDSAMVIVTDPEKNQIPINLVEVYQIPKDFKLGPKIGIYRYETN